MSSKKILSSAVIGLCLVADSATAADFVPIIGVDPFLNPGPVRQVFPTPGPGFPGPIADGNRLAGTSVAGDTAEYAGIGTPMYQPNAFGALSFTFRRGSIPVPPNNRVPILGIDFLGGPLIDMDGDLDNGSRSLIPVFGETPIVIPDSESVVVLNPDFDAGTIELPWMDILGTNEGGPGINPEVSTTINVPAGTTVDAQSGAAINPDFDTRTGAITEFTGDSGTLGGVYAIDDLGYEIWQDSTNPQSSSASLLGTIQLLGSFRGWLVTRDPVTGLFPTLEGEGLGTTLWPAVATEFVGESVVTANGLQGGSATITFGPGSDAFDACAPAPPGNCNGGLAYTDNDGDVGAYFDQVVVPNLSDDEFSFVYLEAAGFGVNNSFDPVFGDTVGWDVVIIAGSKCGLGPEALPGDFDGDFQIDLDDFSGFTQCVGEPGVPAGEGCSPVDFDDDADVDLIDFAAFQSRFGQSLRVPSCLLQGGQP